MSDSDVMSQERRPWLSSIAWWSLTILVLAIVDDLTFGPLFWLLSRIAGPLIAGLTAWLAYTVIQILLVRQGTEESPHRLAAFLLDRLSLERRFDQVAVREQSLHATVTDVVTATLASLVIGGVLPPLILYRRGRGRESVRRISYVTAPIYAAEFGLLHGVLPGLI
jgi:hypothetical protein